MTNNKQNKNLLKNQDREYWTIKWDIIFVSETNKITENERKNNTTKTALP